MQLGPSLNHVLRRVLPVISPSPSELEQADSAASRFVSKLNKELKPKGAKAIIGGSNKKQTQLRNTFEIDVFALFNYKKYSSGDKNLSDILGPALKKPFKKAERIHGSRDYFQVSIKPHTFEVIPILNISSAKQAKNITDVSPLHAKWVARKAKGKFSEIRLTKAFMAACGVYGAESYIRGFSGYACEILAIHYGSFVNVLKAAAKWREKAVIDTEKHYQSRNPLLELNKSKTGSPMIIIDPVQPSRNVTAALSREAFTAFRETASKFLKKPSEEFFKKKTISKKELIKSKGKKTRLLILEIAPEKNKKDVMGTALLGKYEMLREALLGNKFLVEKSSWQWEGGKALLWFLISTKYPGKYEKREGPRVSDKTNSERFRQKHKRAFVSRGRLFATAERRFKKPQELVKSVTSGSRFRNRIKSSEAEWH